VGAYCLSKFCYPVRHHVNKKRKQGDQEPTSNPEDPV
jgi:hypothetical protein